MHIALTYVRHVPIVTHVNHLHLLTRVRARGTRAINAVLSAGIVISVRPEEVVLVAELFSHATGVVNEASLVHGSELVITPQLQGCSSHAYHIT